jgi:beta-glucosidase-like glycosyl hydrolase/CubicO group peptidase (beta-lactamase class C family)
LNDIAQNLLILKALKLRQFNLMLKIIAFFLSLLFFSPSIAQKTSSLNKKDWVDSVFRTLSNDEKIAQLIVVRMSTIDSKTGKVTYYEAKVEDAIRRYKVGGICLFQGGPVMQTNMLNRLQSIAALPALVSIDAETGLGMRMDSVRPLPRQMTLGAVDDPNIIYNYGRWVGKQLRRVGIHMNYAPDVDVNNNPDNPVINDRAFGENKEKVAEYGIMYMKGMQKEGVLTCAKHFPGHGDVAVDSHYDLPVIQKTRQQLDSLELYPFRKLIEAGVDAVMVGHLSIPVIDNTANRASSISYNNVTKLLKQELGYDGLVFTDALEMKGVTKYFPGGEISREAIIAGNDILCLPEDIQGTLEKIKKAIRKRKLSWAQIDQSVLKLLNAKYDQGLANWKPASIANIANDLNSESDQIRQAVAEHAITLLKNNDRAAFPLAPGLKNRIAYIGIGINSDNAFAKRMRSDYNADVFYFDYKQDSLRLLSLIPLMQSRYDAVVIGVHQIRRFPANNFGISAAAVKFVDELQGKVHNSVFVFGNPYAIKNFSKADNIIACYEDERILQETAADMLNGLKMPRGSLPVSIAPYFRSGDGIRNAVLVPSTTIIGMDVSYLKVIDSLADDAIRQKATPGMVVLVAKDGKIAYHKAHGYMTYDSTEKVSVESIYDLASVTKICATTLSIMKLYDEGKLSLSDKIGQYIPWLRGTDKQDITVKDILLHQAGLKSYIQFYRETIDTVTTVPISGMFSKMPAPGYSIRVADSMYMKNSIRDTMYSRIAASPLTLPAKMVYSDNDFIFLGLIVQAISGMNLDDYARKNFYEPLGLVTTGFMPRERFPVSRIVPTENDKYFRKQLLRGDVHDEGAAMFGGISGHAGLFSNAYDLAVVMQMLLNKGVLNGKRYLSDTTIMRFTAYSSDISHRALGFDKPYKDNSTRPQPYPAASASPLTFGHTGFTGIGAWADPANNTIIIMLSNRVYPDRSNKFLQMNVRPNMHEAVYKSLR